MEFRILGPLEVAEGGRPVSLGVPKQRALLAVLLLHANEVVSSERLVDELWGEAPPARAHKLVQHYVSGLRKVLPAGALLTRPPGYVLRAEPGQLDLSEFERLLEEARRWAAEGEPAAAADLYRHALSLWRGPALGGAALEDHAAREAAALDDLRLATLVERIDVELELGRHAELVGELEALVVRHPFQERLRGQLMLALYRAGRQAEALEAYQDARRTLVEQLGLEPSRELQGLERAILQQDPSLELPAAPAPAAEAEQPPPRRKTVTVAACELAAPPADPESLSAALSAALAGLAAAAERHGGRAERLAAGELLAVFGVPEAHEDDALRALRAAARVAGEGLRIGVATGEVLADGTAVTGAAVRAALRLAAEAAPGEVLAGEATLRLAGSSVQSEGSRVLAVAEGRPAFPERSQAPMVGRDEQLARLRQLFGSVVDDRRCRVVTVFGEAGIGKTRLARELVAAVAGQARVLVGRCVAYGEGATWLPLREALRTVDVAAALAGSEEAEPVVQRVAELTGEAEGAGARGEGFWAVRRLLEALGRERPLLLVLEDIHWAEPTLLDLVDYLAEWSSEAPILVLCLARPELRDARPAWGGTTSPIASLLLEPLSARDSEMLVAALAGQLDEEAQRRIAQTAEGNPLYAEQLTAYAADEGAAALAAVPPTIGALLASRLDRLHEQERATLERAAVAGREFTHAAVLQLTLPDQAGAVGRHLHALARRGLIRPAPDDAYRFHHVLIRDVAYAAIPKTARAELHERHADWLDGQDADDAVVGYHLEQAYRFRVELGEESGRTHRLALDAGQRLGAAGVRAWKQTDIPATLNLLGRATSFLPQLDARRGELLIELAAAEWAGGDTPRAEQTLEATIAAAKDARDRRIELRGRVELSALGLYSGSGTTCEHVLQVTAEAIPVFEEMGDDRALARAWYTAAQVHGPFLFHHQAAADAVERARVHHQEAGWPLSPCISLLAAALFYGPRPVSDAIATCRSIRREAGRLGEANVNVFMGGLEAMRGNFLEARRLLASARSAYEELGLLRSIATSWADVGAFVELLEGDYEAVELILSEACRYLERSRERAHLSTLAPLLAQALYAQGRLDDAMQWARRGAACAAEDDASAQIGWRSVQAKVLARLEVLEEAEALAREAAAVAELTDALNHQGQALLDLAEVLGLAGQREEASARIAEAIASFEEKGNVVAARRARSLREQVAAA